MVVIEIAYNQDLLRYELVPIVNGTRGQRRIITQKLLEDDDYMNVVCQGLVKEWCALAKDTAKSDKQ